MEPSSIAGTVVQSIAWLGALAAILVIVARAVGRRGKFGPARSIALTPQHAVHVVSIEGRRYLMGTGPGGPPRLLRELVSASKEGAAAPIDSAWEPKS